jgi:hypothetical protein
MIIYEVGVAMFTMLKMILMIISSKRKTADIARILPTIPRLLDDRANKPPKGRKIVNPPPIAISS